MRPDQLEVPDTLADRYEYYSNPQSNQPTQEPPPEPAEASKGLSGDPAAGFESLRQKGLLNPVSKTSTLPAQDGKTTKSAWHQAGTSPPTGTPEMGWGETLGHAAENFFPSVGGALKSTYDAVRHPLDTASAIGQLGKGAYSQAKGALGFEHDAKDEVLIKALEDHYKQVYGSMEGFKKALAEDPAGIMMDASTFLTAGAGAAGKLGAVEKAAALSKFCLLYTSPSPRD